MILACFLKKVTRVRTKGNWKEWIDFFLRGIRKTSRDALETANNMFALQNQHLDKVKHHLNSYKMAYPRYSLIQKKPIICITEIAYRATLILPCGKTIVW